MSNNQSILQDLGLVEELDEQAGETLTGGVEVFTVKNATGYYIPYTVDGTQTNYPNPGDSAIWTAYSGGIIRFDKDGRDGYEDYKTYNLADGKVYEFQDNKSTPGNPYDIDLYSVA
ncbi:MAG: hypothetical protein V7L14_26695 [Nostoc sp.]|uniref:hypothetical protein n=1 Tax=Nostoc sp. TaxID=1180 RepID=UPI002FFC9FE8